MGKILVLYHSNSGNTKKMAELVAQGVNTVANSQVRLRSIHEATAADLFWCDGIALGSPTNLGTIAWEMKKWWDDVSRETWGNIDGKIGCAFSSSGSWGGGAEITCQALCTVLINFGFLVFGVTDYVGPRTSPHYGSISAGEPKNAVDQESCHRLGKRLAEWVAIYCDGNKKLNPLTADYARMANTA